MVELSPDSSVLSLSGDLPLRRSEYFEKNETFYGPLPFQQPADESVYILTETSAVNSPGLQPDIQTIKNLGVSLTEKVKKLWTRIWGSVSSCEFEYSTTESKSQQAALRFRETLRARDEAHNLHISLISGGNDTRIAFRSEDFADLDAALDDAIASSMIVEGGDEAKEDDLDGIIKISLGVQKTADGSETKVIIVEKLETEGEIDAIL
ncbi:hypothetical protein TWF696_001473 [Orbilia brochopaga]|uniref:Uncharacterized protein n=1 Tax=Orbilia brochopaga TaxID=3140254 RepID=A0AAV9UCR9_9PEZI